MRKKQFIKVVAFETADGLGFEYALVDATNKENAYDNNEFNDEVQETHNVVIRNDLVIDIQELRNNVGSSLNFNKGSKHKVLEIKEIYVKRKLPENAEECSVTNCNECVFDCSCHAESRYD